MLNVLNIPNLLTLLRIVAIPIFLILLQDGRYGRALALFVAAGLTDGLDGAIARLTHTKTTLGAFLDPLADKLLLVSSFLALGFMAMVPRWLVAVVISRDVVIVSGYLMLFIMTRETMEIRPSVFGKLSTLLQLSTVSIVLVRLVRSSLVAPGLLQGFFWLTGCVAGISGLQYVWRGLSWLASTDQVPPRSRP